MRVIATDDKRRPVASGVFKRSEKVIYKRGGGTMKVIAPGDKITQAASGVVGV